MNATADVVLKNAVELFGAKRAAVLFVYAMLLGAMAPAGADRRWVLTHGPMSVPTRYRRVAEFDKLRAALEAAGYAVVDEEPGSLGAALRVAA